VIDPFFLPILLAGAVGGASAGLLGTYIVGMRMPLLGVCVAHGAMAGAVFGSLAGLSPMVCALAGAATLALLVGLGEPARLGVDTNVTLGILLSLTMGLAFLGIGLAETARDPLLTLLWGNLLFVSSRDLQAIVATAAAMAAFVGVFGKELRAILFSRSLAAAAGLHATLVWTLLLILCSLVLTVNLQAVGGLMIYSLMTNPAAAAFLLVRGYWPAVAVSSLLGALSGVGGFLLAYRLDLPTGACIVLVSTSFVLVAMGWRAAGRLAPARWVHRWPQ